MQPRIFCLCLLFGVLASGPVASAAEGAEQWNQFRGPRGDGSSLATGLPTTWSETTNVRWKTPVHGKAWSSPVVWGEQVWLTTATPDGRELSAVGIDLESGKILHDVKVFDIAMPQYCIERNSYASSTPVVEAGRLYVHYGVHGTACLDTKTGAVLWSRQDLPCNHHRGAASSPIVWNDLLIVTFDGYDQQYLVALDKQTGKTVWRTNRDFDYGTKNPDAMKAYGTPLVATVGDHEELITPSAGMTAGYDPRSGKELWRVKSGGMNASCRPVVRGDTAFVCTADGGYRMFAVKVGDSGDVTKSNVLWKVTKGAPRYSSPIVVDDLLYMGSEQGVVTCVEAESGDVVWQERLGGLFMPSPLHADGKLYFFSEEGDCHVIAPGPEFKSLAVNKLAGEFMASPAVAGKSLILRSKDSLYRIADSTSP